MRKLKRMRKPFPSKQQIFPFLQIALSVGFLMSVSGCGELKAWPANLASLDQPQNQVAKKASVDPALRLAPKEFSCLDPGKKAYEVSELEAAVQCKDRYIQALKGRFYSLAKATETLEK